MKSPAFLLVGSCIALAGCGFSGQNVGATPTGNGTNHVSGTVQTSNAVSPSISSTSASRSSSRSSSAQPTPSSHAATETTQAGVTPYYLPNHFTDTTNVTETFASPQLGWKIVGQGVAAGSESASLYRTTNGGTTWTVVARTNAGPGALPPGGYKTGVSFINAKNGWLTGFYPLAANPVALFYHTSNGGHSWQKVSLPLPTTPAHQVLTLMPPAFVSASDAVMVGHFGSTRGVPGPTVGLWVTTNGGTTWNNVPASGPGHDGSLHWDVPHGNTVVVTIGSHSWHTTNDGRTWTSGQ